MKSLIVLFLLSFSAITHAQNFLPSICHKELATIPVQEGGRIKPLLVSATESIKYLNKKIPNGLTYTEVYCLLSFNWATPDHSLNLFTDIHHKDVLSFLKLTKENSEISFEQLLLMEADIRTAYFQIKDENSYKKSLDELLRKINIYKDIKSGNHWHVPTMNANKEVEWVSIKSFTDTFLQQKELKILDLNKAGETFYSKLMENEHAFLALGNNNTKIMTEYYFRQLKLPLMALLLTSLALISLVLFKNFKWVLIFSGATFFAQVTLIALRVYISGRAPVTNMYETVLFSGLGALLLSLLMGHFKNEKIYVYVGLSYNFMTLMMMNFATGMLSESIGPLVPVLRDNFWLSTHVTTIILSYGALALSWAFANYVLIKRKFNPLTVAEENKFSDQIYSCVKWGVVLLALGVILGGVWADYSWGRFWGWDPKETWSLIVLCIYMAILHGKNTNWISKKKFIPLVAGAFMSVMMAWFGVNYILATGLHSYGFSQGGALFLGTFFVIQILLLLFSRKQKVL